MSGPAARKSFAIEYSLVSSQPSICIRGGVDATTVPELRNALLTAIEVCRTGRVYLDLSQVDFIDSRGLGVLIEGRRYARAYARELIIVSPSTAVSSVMAVTGLVKAFDIIDFKAVAG